MVTMSADPLSATPDGCVTEGVGISGIHFLKQGRGHS